MNRLARKVRPKKVFPKVPPPPDEVASLAADIHQLLRAANGQQVEARAEVGGYLLAIKGELSHGDWLPWLEANMPLTPATAKRAIQLFHFRNSDPEGFAALAPLGLTKVYHLMTLPKAEREAFVGQAHFVVSAQATKTPLQMTFAQMMEVLHPPQPETKKVKTTKAFTALRRVSRRLARALGQLVDLAPAVKKRPALTAALRTLDDELDRLGETLLAKSLIAPKALSAS